MPLHLHGNRIVPRVFRGWSFSALAIEDATKGLAVGAVAALQEELLGLHDGNLFRGGDHQKLVHAGSVAVAEVLKSRLERNRQVQREGSDLCGHGLILL